MLEGYADIKRGLGLLPCMGALSEEEYAIIARTANLKRLKRDEPLFEATERVEFFFTVLSGSIKLCKVSPEGKELIIRIVGTNGYFCCAPLFLETGYLVSAVALEDSVLVAIKSEGFKALLMQHLDGFGQKILMSLCKRVERLSKLLDDIAFKAVEQRILHTLLRFAAEKPKGDTAFLTLSHSDIASMTGSVRVVVSRTMSRLKKEGIILESSHKGFVVHMGRLRERLQGCNQSY